MVPLNEFCFLWFDLIESIQKIKHGISHYVECPLATLQTSKSSSQTRNSYTYCLSMTAAARDSALMKKLTSLQRLSIYTNSFLFFFFVVSLLMCTTVMLKCVVEGYESLMHLDPWKSNVCFYILLL